MSQLKQDIVAPKGQLEKAVSSARNEAQRVVDERNGMIEKIERAITALESNIYQERRLRDEATHSA